MAIPMTKMSADQRPRERLWRLGAEALTDAELLAILLRHGRQGESALDMAAMLLAEFGGLDRLSRARPEELAMRPGVGPAKAAAMVAAFHLARRAEQTCGKELVLREAADAASAVRRTLGYARREMVRVLVCDARDKLIAQVTVADGTIDGASVPIREVLNAVLRHDGRAFAVAHNHPSGDATPSLADRSATIALQNGARAVGLRFLGHVVVAGSRWSDITPDRETPG
jgi:DNA repair protein RadC